jgi:hypothetical protein
LKLKPRSTSSGAGAAETPTARAPRRAVAMLEKEGMLAVDNSADEYVVSE